MLFCLIKSIAYLYCVGSSVMQNGVTLKHNYGLDLDTVQTGAVIGMKRHLDGSLHYYLDGEDKGEACTGLPTHIYPVIDLYGQCAQVSYGFQTVCSLEKLDIKLCKHIFMFQNYIVVPFLRAMLQP